MREEAASASTASLSQPLSQEGEGTAARVPVWDREDNANRCKFSALCAMLGRMVDDPCPAFVPPSMAWAPGTRMKPSEKLDMLFSVETRRRLGKQSAYPLVRLIIPQADTARSTYGLSKRTIAKLYVDRLGLGSADNTSEWKRMLLHFNDPKYAQEAVADISAVVYKVMSKRACVGAGQCSDCTIGEINAILDEIHNLQARNRVDEAGAAAAATVAGESGGGGAAGGAGPVRARQRRHFSGQAAKGKVLYEKIITRLSAYEQKWFIRILLKDMGIKLQSDSVLRRMHPSAMEEYARSCDLRHVCAMVNNAQRVDQGRGVELFTPFQPMLGYMARDQLRDIVPLMGGRAFLADVKLDGERMLCHKRGNEVQWWSRRATDYSALYPESMGHVISANVDMEDCILDGEMLAWDNDLQRMIEFGHNRTVANEERDRAETGDTSAPLHRWLCYVVFDVLYINGHTAAAHAESAAQSNAEFLTRIRPHLQSGAFGDIRAWPLIHRRDLLDRIVTPCTHRLEIVQHRLIPLSNPETQQAQLHRYFDDMVNRGEEGLMVKDLISPYTLGERGRQSKKWVKMKPEYSDQAPHLDLVILAGYYAKGFRRSSQQVGHCSAFLLGVKDTHSHDDGQRDLIKFYTFCKVGTGYTAAQLDELRAALQPHMHEWPRNPNALPAHFKNWKPGKTDDVPHVWFDIQHSIVLELKIGGIVVTDQFSSKITARFPRMERVRTDKAWYECMSLQDIRELKVREREQRTAATTVVAERVGRRRKRAPRLREQTGPKVLGSLRIAKKEDVHVVSNMLEGEEFCVLSGTFRYRVSIARLKSENCALRTFVPRQQIKEALAAERKTRESASSQASTAQTLMNMEMTARVATLAQVAQAARDDPYDADHDPDVFSVTQQTATRESFFATSSGAEQSLESTAQPSSSQSVSMSMSAELDEFRPPLASSSTSTGGASAPGAATSFAAVAPMPAPGSALADAHSHDPDTSRFAELLLSKEIVEKLILSCGGSIVANAIRHADGSGSIVVAPSDPTIQVQNKVRGGKFDVMRFDCLLDKILAGNIDTLSTVDLVYATPNLQELLASKEDQFGDPYQQTIDMRLLQRVFAKVDDATRALLRRKSQNHVQTHSGASRHEATLSADDVLGMAAQRDAGAVGAGDLGGAVGDSVQSLASGATAATATATAAAAAASSSSSSSSVSMAAPASTVDSLASDVSDAGHKHGVTRKRRSDKAQQREKARKQARKEASERESGLDLVKKRVFPSWKLLLERVNDPDAEAVLAMPWTSLASDRCCVYVDVFTGLGDADPASDTFWVEGTDVALEAVADSKGTIADLDTSPLLPYVYDLTLRSAEVAPCLHSEVTHVLVDRDRPQRFQAIHNRLRSLPSGGEVHVVGTEWVDACVARGRVLSASANFRVDLQLASDVGFARFGL